jgi:hypothetical protein
VARYDLPEQAAGFFRFFAAPATGFAEQAVSVAAAGLAAGEDPQEAVRPGWRPSGLADLGRLYRGRHSRTAQQRVWHQLTPPAGGRWA